MYVLGLSCYYHDSSATLLKDGKIVAAAAEERFTRNKHDVGFPRHAINFCLKSQGISIDKVDYVGFYEKPMLKFERVLYQHIENFPRSLKVFLNSMPSWIDEKLRIPKKIKKEFGYDKGILFVDHHLAHASSAFLPSPFTSAAIVTVDGVGEWTTTAYGRGEGSKIEMMKDVDFPHSLGLLYSTITAFLGFRVNNSEYKVMGLAPYGIMDKKKNPYYPKMKQLLDLKEDGSFKLDMQYFIFDFKDRMPSKKMEQLFDMPIRKYDDPLLQKHKDMAAALQLVYEEAFFAILNHVHEVTKENKLVIAGGCGLNSVANGKILSNTPFKKVWIQPASGDGGTSLGTTLFIYHALLGNKERHHLKDAFLGPSFSDDDLNKFLNENAITFEKIPEEKKLLKKVARLLYENNVVSWFQGKMEWGPRALGARSILANPCNPKAQDLLNLKVKHREKFRPFAPVVCEDDALEYFECDKPVPEPTDFMLMVYPIRKKWHKKIPSVTHVDGSGRLQTIRREQNHLYYDLIKEFGKLSKIPILINTSFNIRGEPIVCTPYDAYKCMMGTGIDYLVMGNYLIKREDNPRHMWDSEKTAKN